MSHIFFRTKGKNMSVCYSVISTFITKSLLTFFRELHILTVRKLMFPFFEPNLCPLAGGRLIFYTFVRMRISSSVLMDPVHCNTTPPGVFAICFVAFRIAISAAFAMEGKFFALPPNLQEFCPL